MWVEIWKWICPGRMIYVILFVRMWVEIQIIDYVWFYARRHPLREDVSWNFGCGLFGLKFFVILFVRMWVEIVNVHLLRLHPLSHPLREDVSWNDPNLRYRRKTHLSSSSWGCELKWARIQYQPRVMASSSSWGCELKYLRGHGQKNSGFVILFVRMWVEMSVPIYCDKL